ncbi:MAG TPA: 30S ribosome-binding factor RbfA [Bacillota bacterium]|nr:30S ribosome-binding factor RbfA [Bacillota bacterium]
MRLERLQAAMREAISNILREELRDPRVSGLVSVVDVELSRDLKCGTVYVSVLGDDAARQRTLEGLECARGFIRSEVAGRFRLRHVPDLSFCLDRSIERGARILELLADDARRSDRGEQQ